MDKMVTIIRKESTNKFNRCDGCIFSSNSCQIGRQAMVIIGISDCYAGGNFIYVKGEINFE